MVNQQDEITVGRLVAEQPARSQVFERYGIDYCCGGRKSLGAACAEKGLSVVAVSAALKECDSAAAAPERDWNAASLSELADHIERTYHARLRETLPRLTLLTEKVARAHGDRNPALFQLRDVFQSFRRDLEAHTVEEEQILFPLCRELDAARTRPDSHPGSLAGTVRALMAEHDEAGDHLLEMRSLANGFLPPAGACNTYRAMLQALAELEADTHRHVHAENSILFPKAIAQETAPAAGEGAR